MLKPTITVQLTRPELEALLPGAGPVDAKTDEQWEAFDALKLRAIDNLRAALEDALASSFEETDR